MTDEITGEQLLASMKASGKTWVDHHDCGLCGSMVGYIREGDRLYFDSSCGCCSSQPRRVPWAEPADWINMQSPEWKATLLKRFGVSHDR